MRNRSDVTKILRRLRKMFPEVTCALRHESALQLTAATILSAQCTDERVNIVTRDLFARYGTAADYAAAEPEELEEVIRSTGFFRNKAKSLRGMGRVLVEEFGGEVPERLKDLIRLPGVARKTANVVLGTWFGKAEGVVVDTHVGRISRRLGMTAEKDPVKVERDLMEQLPPKEWIDFSHRLVHHGRGFCKARKTDCASCALRDVCPSADA
ncbi:MAG: endonuclease III [Planctomycetota bacterium]